MFDGFADLRLKKSRRDYRCTAQKEQAHEHADRFFLDLVFMEYVCDNDDSRDYRKYDEYRVFHYHSPIYFS